MHVVVVYDQEKILKVIACSSLRRAIARAVATAMDYNVDMVTVQAYFKGSPNRWMSIKDDHGNELLRIVIKKVEEF